jgi:pimeloyl-ACP methyl ester carboxylesterase
VPTGNATADTPGSRGSASPTNVWDLLFAPDRPWTFDELRQGDDLASGSPAGGTAAVDRGALKARAGRRPTASTGDFSRVFESRLFAGDGIRKEAGAAGTPSGGSAQEGLNQTYLYTGRRQYYGMHVPARYPASRGRWPLIVYLHGFTGLPDEAFHNPVGLINEADKRGYIVATPLGRGDYFYKGPGDLDVLEVMRDVQRRYRIDADRIYLMGHSMGGYGSNNVAMHHPDLFAAVAPAQGTDSIPLHGNLRNLPWFEMSSEQDLDTGAKDARSLYGKLSADGYDATLLVYKTKIHEYSSIYDTLPRLFNFFGSHRRVRDPGIVTWTRPDGQDMPRLGLRYDGAYWLRGVRSVPGSGNPAQATVTSGAIRHRVPAAAAAVKTDRMVDEGGPTGRTKAQLTQTIPAGSAFAPIGNTLRIEASGAAALSTDLRRARLVVARGRALLITVEAGHALRLALNHMGGRRISLSLDGHPGRTVKVRRGTATLLVAAGHHTLRLAPHR